MEKEIKKGEIVIYQTPDKKVKIDVSLENETIWLTQDQIALLFGTQRPAITKHLNNIFKSGELDEKSNVPKWNVPNSDKPVKFYSLDAVIAVGYRVNSKRATQFRIWATNTLKNYLLKGYVINEKRLLEAESKFEELKSAVEFLKQKSKHELLAGQEQEILSLLGDYSKTLTLLEQYDTEKVVLSKQGKGKFVLDYSVAQKVIAEIKKELVGKKEASEFFGQENGEKLKGLMGAIYQTFDKKELYPSIEEKAAHILYFIIKDHPFVDGNKRSAAFLFVYFLDKNKYLYRENGERKINDNGLAALALLIAVSDPKEKDKLIKIVTNLLK
ncbi:MAG: virulence protein RhuM/Fic/DOC family protein [Candidatus Staskawiczbacteria bacterium]|nr:virulence protein RhuM/Fic/DOC family protein [Candidatus Staskawiczbacteria bacterium]